MSDKYTLKSTGLYNDVNRSQTNNSKTKQTFSFCKSPRF